MPLFNLTSDTSETGCTGCVLCSGEFELRVVSESVNLALIRDRIKKIAERCRLSERDAFDLQVAVGEAVANAIEHGSPDGPGNVVVVKARCNTDSLTITIVDQGKFIRRVTAPDVENTSCRSDDEIDFRGRGIPLMLALMDKVLIDEGVSGTIVVLEKKLMSAAG